MVARYSIYEFNKHNDSLLLGSRDSNRSENWPLVQYQIWKQVTDSVGWPLIEVTDSFYGNTQTCIQNADVGLKMAALRGETQASS